MRREVLRAKNKAKEKQGNNDKSNIPKLPDQYPTKKNHDSVVNLCSTLANLGYEGEDDSTDDEAISTYAYMVSAVKADPEGFTTSSNNGKQPLEVKAHLEYEKQSWCHDKAYAIADGGADSCIIGKDAKVLSYTGHFASLIGYNPETTKTKNVPIVIALIKARSNSVEGHLVLLKIHGPYNS